MTPATGSPRRRASSSARDGKIARSQLAGHGPRREERHARGLGALQSSRRACDPLRVSSFLDGLRAPLNRLGVTTSPGPRTVEASALLGPTDLARPTPELASPWSDSSQLEAMVWYDIVGDLDAIPLTRAAAMAVPAVARARGMVCNTIARLDLFAVAEATGTELPRDSEAAQFLRNPDPEQPRFIQLTWTVDDLVFSGVSWWLVLARYASSGKPRVARRILPGGVELPKRSGDSPKVYGKPVQASDLIRIDGPHEGILNFGAATLRAASSLERSASRFARNPVPAVELHQTDDYPTTPAERAELVGDWAKARAGENGGVAWTSHNIEAKVHGAPAEHLLTAGRNAAAVDAARIVGTPADAVDASLEHASMTYQNSETRLRVLIDFGLAAYAEAITARLGMDDVLVRGTVPRFRFDQITAATDATDGTPPPPSSADGPVASTPAGSSVPTTGAPA